MDVKRLLAAWACLTSAPATGLSLPAVSVEEGGKVVLPCNAAAVTGCRVQQPNGYMMTAFTDGNGRNASATIYNATHCECLLPPGDAESPMDIQFIEGQNFTAKEGTVQYEALWTTAFGKRPYLSTDKMAELIVSTHPAMTGPSVGVFAQLSPAGPTQILDWTDLPAGVATIKAFSMKELPEAFQLLPLTVVLRYGGSQQQEHGRVVYLSRVLPPPAQMGTFVQVDYTRKTLLVNGKSQIGVGYYDSQSINPGNWSNLAKAGVNWDMRYLIPNNGGDYWKAGRLPDSTIMTYMNWAADSGVYVMFDVVRYVEGAVRGNFTEKWENLTRTVLEFRNHKALLGWYVCDDCTTQYLIEQENRKFRTLDHLYLALKELDPYHPVIGADECANLYTFTTANSRIPRPSLDVVMVENYRLSSAFVQVGISAPPE
eukprot:TRINITY_DN21937_c0_g1_i3.p1 TRINITY_DN21937_c0_g1~~TRINITY_DN21937_c0_g1_i3.p1  ORF type:complete len:428 (+),score=59.37 TRINITY_DN21937_c0_g1_i3:60-1343(+)